MRLLKKLWKDRNLNVHFGELIIILMERYIIHNFEQVNSSPRSKYSTWKQEHLLQAMLILVLVPLRGAFGLCTHSNKIPSLGPKKMQ